MTVNVTKSEYTLPPYPALHAGIVIDARHSSRVDIVKDLKTILLFDQVLEGQSLRDGMSALELEAIDVCFLGPSVTVENSLKFLKRAKDSARSKDCSFIAILNRDDAGFEESEKLLLDAGVHGIVKRPCSKLLLSDWIVRAVVKANGSGEWAKLFLSSGHAKIELSDPYSTKSQSLGVLGVAQPQATASGNFPAVAPFWLEEPTTPADAVRFAALRSAMGKSSSLRELADGVETGAFRLDPTGKLTSRTKEAIRLVADTIVPSVLLVDDGSNDFRRYFETAIEEWVKDLISGEELAATVKFRQTLLAFKN